MGRRYWSGVVTLAVVVVLLTAAGARAATLSPEFPVGTPNSIPSLANEFSHSVACGSTTCVSAWVDSSLGGSSVRAARVNSAGTPLDKPRLQVAGPANSAAVSWDGSAYVVAWTTSRPATGGGTEYVVQARRMGQDAALGAVVDVATSATSLLQVAAASVGGTTLITWVSANDIRGARIDNTGAVLDPGGITICAVAGTQIYPSVGASTTQFLVAWADQRTGTTVQDVYAARVGTDGAVLDPGGGAVSSADGMQTQPHVGSDGSRFLVTWTDYRNVNADVYGARVQGTATVTDPSGIPIKATADTEIAGGVGAVGGADESTFVAAWDRQSAGGTVNSVEAVDISTKFGTLGTEFTIEPDSGSGSSTPSLATRATGFAAVWSDLDDGAINIKRYSAPGTTGDNAHGIIVSWGVNHQEGPTISFDGTNYLLTWFDRTTNDGTATIRAARVQADGTVLDPTGIAVATGVPVSTTELKAAYAGGAHLVVWVANGDIYARRVATNGTLPDAGPIPIATTAAFEERSPAVAGGGANGWFVAWSAGAPSSRDVRGTRISSAGAVLDAPLAIANSVNSDEYFAGVGYNGTDYLVGWYSTQIQTVVITRRVSTAGAMATAAVLGNAAASVPVSIASDGSNWAVMYTGFGLFGQVVNSAGAKSGNAVFFGNNLFGVSITYNGAHYVLVTVASNATTIQWLDAALAWQTFMQVPDADELVVAGGSAGTAGIAYTRWADEAPFAGATRLFFRTVENFVLRVAAVSPVTEGQTISVNVSLTPTRPDRTVTVDYNVTGASVGDDYQATSGTLTFPAGSSLQTISIPTYDDSLDEDDIEYLGVSFTNATNADISNNFVNAYINDNDAMPTLTVDNASVDEGAGPASVDVNLSAASGRDVAVTLQPVAGTAGGLDYTLNGTVNKTIPAGDTTASVSVPITSDNFDEDDETFDLQVQSAPAATYAPGEAGTVTIVDDDAAPTASVGAAQVLEGDSFTSPATVPVQLSSASGKTVTVSFDTSNGTASAPGDYAAAVGQTVTFNPGQISKNVSVSVNGDATDEADETFNADISSPSNATLGTNSALVTIQDDDGPDVSFGDASVGEGNSGAAQLSVPITLSAPSPNDVSGVCTTQDASALAGSDYTARSAAAFSVPAGASVGAFVVDVTGDNLDESDETLGLTCTVGRTGNLADGQATGTIVDDDTSTISAIDATVTEGLPAVVHVQLSGPSVAPISVRVKTADGAATAPGDYGAVDQVVNFVPGDTDKTVEVPTVQDDAVEPDERLAVALSEATGAAAVRDGMVTIVNDDAAPSPVTKPGAETPPATSPPPETATKPAAAVVIKAGNLKLDKRGRVKVTLTCPAAAGAAPCSGRLKLVTAGKVRVAAKRRLVTLGTATFSIARGKPVAVVVKLSRKNVKLVKALRSLRVAISAGNVRRVVKLRVR